MTLKSRICFLTLFVAAYGFSWQKIEVHGFLSQGYLDSSDHNFLANSEDGTFEFSEAAVNVTSQINERLRVGIQFFSRDLGDQGNHKVTIDWAYGDYRWKDQLGVRLGKVKMPLGFYNQGRDADLLRSTILLPQSVYPEGLRDILLAYQGAGLYGDLPGNLEYEIYIGNVSLDEDSPAIQSLVRNISPFRPTKNPDVNNSKLYGAWIKWETPLEGLSIGASRGWADIQVDFQFLDDQPVRAEIQDMHFSYLSCEYISNRWHLAGEWHLLESRPKSEIITDTRLLNPMGWYIQSAFRVNDLLELNASYNQFYSSEGDKQGEELELFQLPKHLGWQKSTSLGIRFDINAYWIIKAEWQDIDGLGLLYAYDPNSLFLRNPLNFTRNWNLYALKATFNF